MDAAVLLNHMPDVVNRVRGCLSTFIRRDLLHVRDIVWVFSEEDFFQAARGISYELTAGAPVV